MNETPNFFAVVALLFWPLLALWVFSVRPLAQALIWAVLGGYLLLPVNAAIAIQGIPQLDKIAATSLSVLIGCFLRGWRPQIWKHVGIVEILMLAYLFGPLITSGLNGDPIIVGDRFLPGVGLYDGISTVVSQIFLVLPFFLSRNILNRANNIEDLLRILVTCGLLYSIPMLFEMRMSPQLHLWIYGYFPSSFVTESRYGGFRPVVFLQNGLVVALFVMTATIASAAFWRNRTRILSLSASAVTAYLGTILILCKTAGVLVIGAGLIPLVRFAKPKVQVRVAVGLIVVALSYPALRSMDLFPHEAMLNLASSFSAERASSLKTRFDQEEKLLQRASERFWFGWGRFGRSRVYDEYGEDISLTDGQWIITMGQFGFVGFIATFGLLGIPVFRAASALRFAVSHRDAIFLGATTLILAANVIDQLPNASISPWTWLLAGALLGRTEALRAGDGKRLQEGAKGTNAVASPTMPP